MRTADVITTTEGPYMRSGCHRSHRGPSRGIGQISDIRRTYGSHYTTEQPTRERRFHTLFSLAGNVQFRQPQRTLSADAPQQPQSGFYHADGRFIGQIIETSQKPF